MSIALGTSADGSVVTGFSYSDQGVSAFRWTQATGIEELPRSNGPGTYDGLGASPSGNYIAGRYQGLGSVWSEAAGTLQIGDLPGGIESSFVHGITDTGVVAGSASHGFNSRGAATYHAVRWTLQGGLEALPLPQASDVDGNSYAWSILDDGRVFGASESGVWIYSETDGFEMLPGAEMMTRTNRDGTFFAGQVIDFVNFTNVPAYWTHDSGLVRLPGLAPDESGNVYGISDDGSVIVGRRGVDPVVWIDRQEPIHFHEYAESFGIDMTGWFVTNVYGVSADGKTFVGGVRNVNWDINRTEGFVLTISDSCPADVNGDGELTPSDFTAWTGAFNDSLPACDQNGDGACTPSDFAAWITNYNAGC